MGNFPLCLCGLTVLKSTGWALVARYFRFPDNRQELRQYELGSVRGSGNPARFACTVHVHRGPTQGDISEVRSTPSFACR